MANLRIRGRSGLVQRLCTSPDGEMGICEKAKTCPPNLSQRFILRCKIINDQDNDTDASTQKENSSSNNYKENKVFHSLSQLVGNEVPVRSLVGVGA